MYDDITGGQGGTVVQVTNLNASGAGSLYDAMTRTDIGARIIQFTVSGNIVGVIDSDRSDITVAGYTSPNGICLRNPVDNFNDTLNLAGDNIILDDIRLRAGYNAGVPSEHRRCLNLQGSTGVAVKNCAISWGYDQIVGTWYGASDIWLYRNMIYEGFHDNSTGKYGMGCLCGNSSGSVYFYQNIFAHNRGRNPKTNLSGSGKTFLWNNLVYNPGEWVMHMIGSCMGDVIGNVVIKGTNSNNNSNYLLYTQSAEGEIYHNDNIAVTRTIYDDSLLTIRETPFMTCPFPLETAANLTSHIVRVAGPTIRDASDQRIIRDIINTTGAQITNESSVGGYPDLTKDTGFKLLSIATTTATPEKTFMVVGFYKDGQLKRTESVSFKLNDNTDKWQNIKDIASDFLTNHPSLLVGDATTSVDGSVATDQDDPNGYLGDGEVQALVGNKVWVV